MEMPRTAVQTIVFSSVVKQEGYDRMMRFIQQQGVREVELSKVPVNRDTVPQIEALCQELGLPCQAVTLQAGCGCSWCPFWEH